GNASSGRQGIALAQAAALRGARVTLVAANVTLPLPAGCEVKTVRSTADLAEAMFALQAEADAIVMAAAPADFTPDAASDTKIKKDGDGGLTLTLLQTTDVLATLSGARPREQVIVGFAAETATDEADLMRLGQAKLERKGCDLLVLNNVSGGAVFGQPDNTVTIIDAGGVVEAAAGDKSAIAHRIWDAVVAAGLEKK
ncbi:MAG: phosphopantothenoylcysteine decarboxylase, partial [Propionibacteriaceae bacterium]|nr:phosphopantothenoylcysteine decarboxylase [Propionibacteriaceae bacterium]